jgi:hypothetical protein
LPTEDGIGIPPKRDLSLDERDEVIGGNSMMWSKKVETDLASSFSETGTSACKLN